ncbi:MAG: DUF3473 domain-containing protein [Candidatus Aureabacteria bacterium]|nr:DUF3473 domain-containing protein [Candidatus Auribacterota bacterium]
MDRQERIVNALSFDVEEWFQAEIFSHVFPRASWETMESRVERQVDVILDILARHNVRATFFTLGWVAERAPGVVRSIVSGAHELACHGYDHTMITRLSRGEFDRDLTRARTVLEQAGGAAMGGYRAPTFSITSNTLWALDALLDQGFTYDASIYPIRHDRYGIPGARRFPHIVSRRGGRVLWEFPGMTVRIAGVTLPAGGGGYLRLFPYAWTARAIRQAHRNGEPANVFAHPWEFDTELPRPGLKTLSRFRHYGGISRNARTLARLLGEFRFAPMGEVISARAAGGRGG